MVDKKKSDENVGVTASKEASRSLPALNPNPPPSGPLPPPPIKPIPSETPLPKPAEQLPTVNPEIKESPELYPLGCHVWTPCPMHSGMSFLICRACRIRILRDGDQVRLNPNGSARVSFDLCADCIRPATENRGGCEIL